MICVLVRLLLIRNGERVPALRPAAGQDEASTLGCHASPEPEGPGPLRLAGLISPFTLVAHVLSPIT